MGRKPKPAEDPTLSVQPIPALETLFNVLQIRMIGQWKASELVSPHSYHEFEVLKRLWVPKFRVKVPYTDRLKGVYPRYQYTVDLAIPYYRIGVILDRRYRAAFDPHSVLNETSDAPLPHRFRRKSHAQVITRKPHEEFVHTADFLRFKLLYELGWTIYYVNQHDPLLLSPGGCAQLISQLNAKYPVIRKVLEEYPTLALPTDNRPRLYNQLDDLQEPGSVFTIAGATIAAEDAYNPDDDPEYIGMLEAMKGQSAAPTAGHKKDEALHFGHDRV